MTDILEKFKTYLLVERKGGLQENTTKKYLKHLSYLYKEHGSEILNIKKYQEISSLIASVKVKRNWRGAMTKNTADICCVYFNWAYRMGFIEESPFRMGHEFRNRDPKQFDFFDWESEDFKKIVYDPNNSIRENAIIHTLRSSGVRAAELCGIKKTDLKDRWLRVDRGKGQKERYAPIDEECKRWLDIYVPMLSNHYQGEYLYVNEAYRPYNPHSLWKWLHNKGKRLGIRVYPHKFRKSLGGEIIKRGGDITIAQHVLGHADERTTANSYVHFRKESLLVEYDKAISIAK